MIYKSYWYKNDFLFLNKVRYFTLYKYDQFNKCNFFTMKMLIVNQISKYNF